MMSISLLFFPQASRALTGEAVLSQGQLPLLEGQPLVHVGLQELLARDDGPQRHHLCPQAATLPTPDRLAISVLQT